MTHATGPCMCGAEDCRRCYPEHFDRRGRYIYAECAKCGQEFVPEDEDYLDEPTCPGCKAKEEQEEE